MGKDTHAIKKPTTVTAIPKDVAHAFKKLAKDFEPFEALKGGQLHIFTDRKSGARFCECHVLASKLVPAATTDVPLDPEEQSEYRANRELVTDAAAFARMKEDAVAPQDRPRQLSWVGLSN